MKQASAPRFDDAHSRTKAQEYERTGLDLFFFFYPLKVGGDC